MNRPNHHTMLGAGWFLATVLTAWLVIWPAHRDFRALEREIETKRAELSNPGDGPEAIEKLATDLAALRKFGDERMTPIPSESGVAQLVRELSLAFDELGLRDREITTGGAKPLEEASAMPMTIMLGGKFPAIHRAVTQIESLNRLVRVQRLRIATEKPTTQGFDRSGRVRADVLLDVFYAPRSLAGAPVEGGAP